MMGERTWVEILTFPENEKAVEEIMGWPPEEGWGDTSGWTEGWNSKLIVAVFSDVNYGISTELTSAFEGAGLSLMATAGACSGVYGCHAASFYGGESEDIRSDDEGMPVVGVNDGVVSEQELERVRRFEKMLIAAGIKVAK